ncbi:MAG TPA: phosphate acyltransferase PlsX [Bacteroidales bacterium]|jgi:glycerol-3-phosphate acyltransferase PlsX|nr:phosphate acyltransferase PlsX [Bacteroidales bacterium]HNR40997.1 phosphate acyltransferase PlsX [Bacteroidales bacterium]HPM17623.1 phosphate acyltransferase PlsX [Bacteroidales bacterium]HPV15758.1 phosphate acyltransferase PlsX [Bacteroidales bacterium]HQG75885.1 phosphate acyltransferase PlsX [Bacteroidales bacterium]
MRIGFDVMGGDFAPEAMIEGAVDSISYFGPDEKLVLIGDKREILKKLEEMNTAPDLFEIVHSSQVIEMGDHPAKAFSQKRDSSIAIGYEMLKQGLLDGFCSAGNTGAMLVGASYTVNVIPGVFRPALATILPCIDGRDSVILDVGLNPDCKPDVLLQYGILGSIYARFVLGKNNPTVGLLNIGIEETKGTPAIKAAYELMKDYPGLNFSGNVEGNTLFHESVTDVLVCDGFVGNIILKQAEAFFSISEKLKISHPFIDRMNFENIGGTPVVGINANVVIGHGISRRKAIKNMILQTKAVVGANLARKIIEAI